LSGPSPRPIRGRYEGTNFVNGRQKKRYFPDFLVLTGFDPGQMFLVYPPFDPDGNADFAAMSSGGTSFSTMPRRVQY
jgi:hypothetical protein